MISTYIPATPEIRRLTRAYLSDTPMPAENWWPIITGWFGPSLLPTLPPHIEAGLAIGIQRLAEFVGIPVNRGPLAFTRGLGGTWRISEPTGESSVLFVEQPRWPGSTTVRSLPRITEATNEAEFVALALRHLDPSLRKETQVKEDSSN